MAGAWQMGPNLDGTLIGCAANDGFARITGMYYMHASGPRVYFLGARCENNSTTGTIFYLDLSDYTYHTTGATMPTPVSNYQVVLLDDGQGHGPGMYVVGGRPDAGGVVDTVQVYYPDDNTVATIATDPYPFAVSPGGVVVVGGKIYGYGGFDGTAMYAATYVYDPAAAAGSRWTDTGCDLPTARSYIAGVAIGNLIYAIGGDELPALTPIADTVVLDTADMASCWQDDLMADLPSANGDATAAYVNDPGTYLDGGIYVVGGMWPSPGPYRWVFRYDLATDTWEDFPQLAIPAPATGRRNEAVVYVPASAGPESVGNGIPGLWAFGGYDGSGTNAMTASSEFFSVNATEVILLPDALDKGSVAGTAVDFTWYVWNKSGVTETFDLTYTSDVTWNVTMPASIGPLAPDELGQFDMGVDLPVLPCPATGVFTVTATGQGDPALTDSQAVTAHLVCGLGGRIYDATTGAPLANAYVWIQTDPAGLTGDYYDAFTDGSGQYVMLSVNAGTYYFGADRQYYQASFYPTGWPTGALTLTVGGFTPPQDYSLLGSDMGWTPDSWTVDVAAGASVQLNLALSNDGTGPLVFNLNELAPTVPVPPPAAQQAPRIDPQILSDLQAAPDGRGEFLVVLKGEANLDAAYAIKDWNARGQYVLNQLQATANRAQRGLRSFLDARGVDYEPLYIINAVIVRGGNEDLVNELANRPDIDYLQANYRIAVEEPASSALQSTAGPEAVVWGIHQVKADQVWSTFGVRGEGTVVAEIDTGTQYDHPALFRQYRGCVDPPACTTYDHNYNWFDPYAQCPSGGTVPCDPAGHGTHVMGTMVGEDPSLTNQVGMAPGARWITCKGGDAVSGYLLTDELLQCAEWIVAPFDLSGQNPDPAMRPNVVNNSWGGGPNDYWYSGAVAAWRAAGIFPSFATGNSGPNCSSAHSPGDNWNSFGVGATDNTDTIASFSGRGPAPYTGALKPQISAPGVNVCSSVPGNGYSCAYSGTSMATPHASGAVALLWSAVPDLIGQIDTSAWILEQNALPLTTTEGCGGDTPTDVPNNTYGWGRLDILAAVTAARASDWTIPWLQITPSGGTVEPSGTMDIALDVTAPITTGLYTGTVWLIANDPYNHDVRLPIAVNVVPPTLTVGFTSSSPNILGQVTYFTNTTAGTPPISYTWNFGDATPPLAGVEYPTHTYAAAGTYTVWLTATNAAGTDVASGTVEILPLCAPVEILTITPTIAGCSVSFEAALTGDAPFTYLWSFGDGVTDTVAMPTHVYATGTYTGTLEVSNCGTAGHDAMSFTVTVECAQFWYVYLPIVYKGQ
jgi:subtilisin family serine protease